MSFARIVSLGCHDLRTPLAAVSGFAKTLERVGELDERNAHFVSLIDGAADELTELIDQLGVLARIEAGSYAPVLESADTLALASSTDERVLVTGGGEAIDTAVPDLSRSLEALAIAAVRHGELDQVTWTVRGRELELAPVTAAAGPIVTGADLRDFGAAIAGRVIEALGGSLSLEGETLLVKL